MTDFLTCVLCHRFWAAEQLDSRRDEPEQHEQKFDEYEMLDREFEESRIWEERFSALLRVIESADALGLGFLVRKLKFRPWADENFSSRWPKGPLFSKALYNGHLEVARCLLENGFFEHGDTLSELWSNFKLAADCGLLEFLYLLYQQMSNKAIQRGPEGVGLVEEWKCIELGTGSRKEDGSILLPRKTDMNDSGSEVSLYTTKFWSAGTEDLSTMRVASVLAARKGNLNCLGWLYNTIRSAKSVTLEESTNVNMISFTIELVQAAIDGGRREIFKWLLNLNQTGVAQSRYFVDQAVKKGDMEFLNLISKELPNLDVVHLRQYSSSGIIYNPACVTDWAAQYGKIDILTWLFERGLGFSKSTMDTALYYSQIETCQWLHQHGCEGPSRYALGEVCRSGHLEAVKFINSVSGNDSSLWTKEAMHWAAVENHEELVKYLHKERDEGCYPHTLPRALKQGHTEIAAWLYNNRPEGVEESIIVQTENGHDLPLKEWLEHGALENITGLVERMWIGDSGLQTTTFKESLHLDGILRWCTLSKFGISYFTGDHEIDCCALPSLQISAWHSMSPTSLQISQELIWYLFEVPININFAHQSLQSILRLSRIIFRRTSCYIQYAALLLLLRSINRKKQRLMWSWIRGSNAILDNGLLIEWQLVWKTH